MLSFKMPIKMTLKSQRSRSRVRSRSSSRLAIVLSNRPHRKKCKSWINSLCFWGKMVWVSWNWWIIRVGPMRSRGSLTQIWLLEMVMNHRRNRKSSCKVWLIFSSTARNRLCMIIQSWGLCRRHWIWRRRAQTHQTYPTYNHRPSSTISTTCSPVIHLQ